MDVRVCLLAAVLAAWALAAAPATAAPGDLDPSFSGDGRVSTLTSADTFVARAVAVQPDGRIVVAGYSCDTATCGPTGDSSFRLARYTADGGLDTDFGQGGLVTTAIGAGRSQAFDVLVRPDGEIVAGGVASVNASDPGSFALAAYRPDGRLDPGFGAGGRVVMPVGEGFDAISDLVSAGDRLVAVGQAEAGGHTRFALARFNRRGAPDPAFGHGGAVVLGASAPYAYAAGGVRLPDGRFVAVGASGQNSAVESLRLSGAPVGSGGAANPPWIRPIGTAYSYANAATALSDGRVLSAGVATEGGGNPAMALVRTSPEGRLDPSWDGDGTALVRARDGSVATDVVLDPSGRAVAAGHSSLGEEHEFMLARFGPDGTLDRGFGGQGVALTTFPGTTMARATALALQGDGKLVAAGIACASGGGPQCAGGTARLALARYFGGDFVPSPPPGQGVLPAQGPGPRTSPFVGLPARLRARHGRVRVRVRCLQKARCRGRLTLRRLRSGRRPLPLGSRRISVAGRHAKTVTVKLRRGRLGSAHRLRVRIEVRGRDAAGTTRLVTRRVTLRR
jgi:uncharacterized delta-60 repeat protein